MAGNTFPEQHNPSGSYLKIDVLRSEKLKSRQADSVRPCSYQHGSLGHRRISQKPSFCGPFAGGAGFARQLQSELISLSMMHETLRQPVLEALVRHSQCCDTITAENRKWVPTAMKELLGAVLALEEPER